MPDDIEDPDDDALHWRGDDVQAPTRDEMPRPRAAHTTATAGAPPATAGGRVLEGAGPAAAVSDATAPTAAEPAEPGSTPQDAGEGVDGDADERAAEPSSVALVALGLLGGVYLLFAIGWAVGAFRLEGQSPSFAGDPMFLGALWLAVLGPVVWFVTTLLLTRDRPGWVRFLGLVVGAVLLVPWPFLMVGPVAA